MRNHLAFTCVSRLASCLGFFFRWLTYEIQTQALLLTSSNAYGSDCLFCILFLEREEEVTLS